ncbi:MAG: sialidase family protein [Betaproteobacteria bacterium]
MIVKLLRRLAALVLFAASAPYAAAAHHTFVIDEVYSTADGTVQFIVLRESQNANGENLLAGQVLTSTIAGVARTFKLPNDLPSTATAGKHVLLASEGFAALNLITPDYTFPDRFVAVDGGSVDYAGVSTLSYASLPADGVNALFAPGSAAPNVATNFSGLSVVVTPSPITVVEYFEAALDHYFISPLAPDINALDSGRTKGWTRTGLNFSAFPSQASGGAGVNPVCRFYIPPQHGNSHFFSASPKECNDALILTATNPSFSGYIHETPAAFYIALPNTMTGACPLGTVPVYRLWNQRFDSNHRFTTDASVKAQMVAKGYVAEGYGPDNVAMCTVSAILGDAQFLVSAATPYTPGCDGVPQTGTSYANAEVEPTVSVNPLNPDNIVGVWQQDRWSNGGAKGLRTGASFDGGRTWTHASPTFTRCAGGSAANGGDYERASDPWVSFAPDGTAHQLALAIIGEEGQPGAVTAILASRSVDGGRTWSMPSAVIRDGATAFNDKNAITADATDARYVYATWDRLAGDRGPTYLGRSIDGGLSWEVARPIYDPGPNAQTLNNQIVVLPNGTLINFFTLFNPMPTLAIIRSLDKGATWSAPITIALVQALGVQDPEVGTEVRDSAMLGAIAVSRQGTLYATWQDSRFTAGARDGIALSSSSDGGLTWSAPVNINRYSDVAAFSPTVAVLDNGTIGVTYYDFRNNTSDPGTLLTDLWLTQSADGVTWRETHVSGPFDLSTAPNARGLFLGDYHALVGIDTAFLPFYVQTNSGDFADRTAVYASRIVSTGHATKAAAARSAAMAPLRAATAPPLAMTPELQARLQTTVQRVLERRKYRAESAPNPQ